MNKLNTYNLLEDELINFECISSAYLLPLAKHILSFLFLGSSLGFALYGVMLLTIPSGILKMTGLFFLIIALICLLIFKKIRKNIAKLKEKAPLNKYLISNKRILIVTKNNSSFSNLMDVEDAEIIKIKLITYAVHFKAKGKTLLFEHLSKREAKDAAQLFYFSRGNQKFDTNEFDAAIQDYSASIKIEKNNAEAYYNRGYAKILSHTKGACTDIIKSKELGFDDPYQLLKQCD